MGIADRIAMFSGGGTPARSDVPAVDSSPTGTILFSGPVGKAGSGILSNTFAKRHGVIHTNGEMTWLSTYEDSAFTKLKGSRLRLDDKASAAQTATEAFQLTAQDEKTSVAQETITKSYTSVAVTVKFKAATESAASEWVEKLNLAIAGNLQPSSSSSAAGTSSSPPAAAAATDPAEELRAKAAAAEAAAAKIAEAEARAAAEKEEQAAKAAQMAERAAAAKEAAEWKRREEEEAKAAKARTLSEPPKMVFGSEAAMLRRTNTGSLSGSSSSVLAGWTWQASLTGKTCAVRSHRGASNAFFGIGVHSSFLYCSTPATAR